MTKMRRFGSSRNPAYLEKQIADLETFIDRNGWQMNRGQMLQALKDVGKLTRQLLAVTNPAALAESDEQARLELCEQQTEAWG